MARYKFATELNDEEEDDKKKVAKNSPTYKFAVELNEGYNPPAPKSVAKQPLISMDNLLSSHASTNTPQQPTTLQKLGKGLTESNIGGIGYKLGAALKNRDFREATPYLPDYEPQTFGDKALNFVGANLGDLGLWMAGDALLAKPLAALAKTAPISKAISALPKAITPALGTGVRAGTTYGGVIAPAETALEGDGLEGLLQREKQVPLMALGGSLLHGGGQLAGKGISETKSLLKPRGVPAEPFGPIRPPEPRSVQRSAGAGPLKISDTLTPEYKARQAELINTFKDLPIGSVDAPLATKTLQQGIDESVGIGKSVGDYEGLDAFGKSLKSFMKSTDEPMKKAIPQKGIPVYRGFAIGEGAKDTNLVKSKGIMDVLNEVRGAENKPKYNPIDMAYYTESKDVAGLYANQDKNIMEKLVSEYGEVRAKELFNTFYGREPMDSGVVKSFNIKPKKVLDISDLGENPNPKQLINRILESEGSPVPTYTRGENVNAPKWQRYNEIEKDFISDKIYDGSDTLPAYSLLRNNGPNDTSANKFMDWLKKNGYDTVRYSENDTRHYATMGDVKSPITKSDIKLKPRELTPKFEPLPIQPKRMGLSGNLPAADTPFSPVKQLRSTTSGPQPLRSITPENVGQLPGRQTEALPLGRPEPIRSIAANVERPTSMLTLKTPNQISLPRVEPSGTSRLSFPDTVAEGKATDPALAEQIAKAEMNAGTITNKDTLELGDKFIRENGKDEAMRIVLSDEPPTAESNAIAQLLIKEAQDAGKFDQAISIVAKTSQKARTQGQAIQALSMWGRLSPEGILKYADGIVKKANEAGKTSATKLNEQAAKDLFEQSNAIQGMVEGSRERQVATAKMLDTVAAQVPPSFLHKVATLQTMAQLLNPKTAIKNLGGNTGFAVLENVSQALGTGIDKVVGAITKQRTLSLPSLKTQLSGGKEGFKLGLEDAIKGIDTSGLGSQFDLNPTRTFRKGILGKAETALNIELRAPDRAFYQAAYDDSLRSQMKAAKVTEPTDAMKEIADYDGKYRTFQDKNYLSDLFSTFKQKLNGDKDFGIGDFVIKYPKTPASLLSRGIDYSPAGFVKAIAEAAKPLMGKSGKEFNQRAFVQAFSRATVGSTGLVGMGALLHRTGIISGARDQDKDVAALNDSVGLGQYKINVSALKRFALSGFDADTAKLQKGDTLVTYDWFQPQALPIAMGADIDKNGAKAQGVVGTVLNGLATGVNAFAEQPVMQGLQTLVGQRDFSAGITQILQGIPASFVPTFLNQIKQLSDNQKRNTYSPDWTEKATNLVASKIPLIEKKLQPSYDALGNKAETYQGGGNNPLNVFLNPSFVSKYSPSKEAGLALNAFKQTGETKQIPTIIPKYFEVTGKRFDLTSKEYADMQKIVGEKTKKAFGSISPNAKPDKQIDDMANAIEKARFEGKKMILDGRGVKYSTSGKTFKLKQ